MIELYACIFLFTKCIINQFISIFYNVIISELFLFDFKSPEEQVKAFMAGNPILSEYEATMRYYSVSTIIYRHWFILSNVVLVFNW